MLNDTTDCNLLFCWSAVSLFWKSFKSHFEFKPNRFKIMIDWLSFSSWMMCHIVQCFAMIRLLGCVDLLAWWSGLSTNQDENGNREIESFCKVSKRKVHFGTLTIQPEAFDQLYWKWKNEARNHMTKEREILKKTTLKIQNELDFSPFLSFGAYLRTCCETV